MHISHKKNPEIIVEISSKFSKNIVLFFVEFKANFSSVAVFKACFEYSKKVNNLFPPVADFGNLRRFFEKLSLIRL